MQNKHKHQFTTLVEINIDVKHIKNSIGQIMIKCKILRCANPINTTKYEKENTNLTYENTCRNISDYSYKYIWSTYVNFWVSHFGVYWCDIDIWKKKHCNIVITDEKSTELHLYAIRGFSIDETEKWITSTALLVCCRGLRKKVPSTSGYRSNTWRVSLQSAQDTFGLCWPARVERMKSRVSSLPWLPSSSIWNKEISLLIITTMDNWQKL